MKRTLPLPWVLGLAAMAALLLFALDHRHEQSTAAGGESLGARERDPLDAHESTVEPAESPIRTRGFDSESPAVISAPSRKSPLVHGTVVAIDQQAVEHAELDGELVVSVFTSSWSKALVVGVSRGRWAIDSSGPGFLRIESCALGGRPVYCDPRLVEVPKGQPVALRGAWAAETTLRVLSESSGSELANIRVFSGGDWRLLSRNHPGSLEKTRLVATNQSSPFTMPMPAAREQAMTTYWVISPEHAWGKIRIDHGSGGERKLIVAAGGSLAVDISGPDVVDENTWLCLRRSKATARAEVMVPTHGKRSRTIEGVEVGDWQLSLEKGDPLKNRVALATAPVTIRQGETTHHRFELEAGATGPAKVPLAGTLLLPSEWPRRGVALVLEAIGTTAVWAPRSRTIPISSMTPLPGRDDTLAWSAGSCPVGSYVVRVHPMNLSRLVALPESGDESVAVIVPPPVTITVCVTDSRSRKRLANGEAVISWYPRLGPDVPSIPPYAPLRTDASGRVSFQAPRGAITVTAQAAGYESTTLVHEVGRDGGEVVISLTRWCGIRLILKDGDAVVPFDWERASLEEIGGSGKVRTWTKDRISVTNPGTYRLTLEPIEGFRPIPPRELLIGEATWTEVIIPLERR